MDLETYRGELVAYCYRLLTFPTVLGAGTPLFPAGGAGAELECVSAERTGAAVLSVYRRR